MIALALLCVLPWQSVPPGEAVVGRLSPGADAVHELPAGPAGTVSVTVESYDFDPELAVLDDRGSIAGHAAGPGPAARVEVRRDGAVGWRAVVASEDGRGGRYLLTMRSGDEPRPEEDESAALQRVFGALVGDELERGDGGQAHELQHRLGELLFARADYPAAGPAFSRALDMAETRGNAWGAAVERAFLGAVERRVGSDERAVALLLDAADGMAGRAPPQVDCFVFENLGEALTDLGRDADALEAFQSFRRRAAEAGLAPFEALALARVGRMQQILGDAAAAASSHERALAIIEGIDDDYITSQVLLAAGQFAVGESRLDVARERYERALSLTTTWDVTLVLEVQLGGVLLNQGHYGPARACLERARALMQGRRDRRFAASVLDGLSDLAAGMGDLAGAARLVQQALELAESQGETRRRIDLLTDLGSIREQLDDLSAAEEVYGRAEALCRGQGEDRQRWRIAQAQARLAHERGDLDQARRLGQHALELALALEDPKAEAITRGGIAWSSLALGRLDDAGEQAERSRALFEQTGQTDDLLVGPLHTLARVALARDDVDEAERLLASAEAIIEREDVTGLAPLQAAGVRSTFAAWGEVAQDVVVARLADVGAEREALLERGLALAGRWKGRALLEGMRLVVPDAATPLAPVRDALGAGRVLVEYVEGSLRLYAYVLDTHELRLVDLGPRAGLDERVDEFLAGMTDVGHLASADVFARQGRRLHAQLLAPVVDGLPAGVHGLVIVPTPGLARLPFEALVTGGRATDDGDLDFAELEFLADRFDVVYGPSVPVLARLAELGPRRTRGRTLLLGDPLYASERASAADPDDRHTGAPPAASPGHLRLPATKDEVLSIAAALLGREAATTDAEREVPRTDPRGEELARMRRARSGAFASDTIDLYLGEQATAERLKGDLREYAVVHVAAHGEVDTADPLRSGLVLSQTGRAGGYVSVADILESRLDADMVVLSACGTAKGRVLKGEGVQSLAQAFLQAGARSVVASLWSVDDISTRQTMVRFYTAAVLEGRGRARALHDARPRGAAGKASSRWPGARGASPGEPLAAGGAIDPRHPYFWAPFIYVGAIPPPEAD